MKIFYTDTILLDLQQSLFATNFQKDHFIIKLAEKIANNFYDFFLKFEEALLSI